MNTPFNAHNIETHAKALRAFRRRHQFKRVRSAAQLLAILALGGIWFSSRHIPVKTVVNVPPSPLPITRPEPHSLTDEELIAKFPPGSCFMAEVNGKKILVFKDPQVEKQFFQ
jgi:hypothetical protein